MAMLLNSKQHIQLHLTFPVISTPLSKHSLQNTHLITFKTKPLVNICCCSTNNDTHHQNYHGFSKLEGDPPWETGSVWTTMALYFFSLHVPLSFGGLSMVASLLGHPNLDPQLKAVSILAIETLELCGALLLLRYTAKPHYKLANFFMPKELQTERNWVLASVLGFLVLDVAIFLTSFLADRLNGAEGVNNQVVKEILSSGIVSQTACTLVYCIVAPLLEEIVYRGFFLASLAPTMQWYQAVTVSSVVFSAAHLSGENFFQLFIIGLVLGSTYCWTGDLRSSILLHSMYNVLTLFITYFN